MSVPITVLTDLPKHPRKRYRYRNLDRIDTVVVHHSATADLSGSRDVYAFARYHVRKGWPGIGYHYVVDRDGTIYKCNPMSRRTYHAGRANTRSLGVCLVGNYDRERLVSPQRDSLVGLLRELRRWDPALRIIGHRDLPLVRKSCPGRNIDLDALREAVEA